jgi:hypothetical protein
MFIRAMVRIFSFGERWNVPFNSAIASLNGTFRLSPHENILTIARINIHYLYNITWISIPLLLLPAFILEKFLLQFRSVVPHQKLLDCLWNLRHEQQNDDV